MKQKFSCEFDFIALRNLLVISQSKAQDCSGDQRRALRLTSSVSPRATEFQLSAF